MSNILELTPYWEEKVWGGHRLEKIKNLPSSDTLWGESFEISILEGRESTYQGKKLTSIISREKLPYLVKLLDTSADLSIQVHPDNQYAREFEGTSGKTECWVILHAEAGAGLYLGFKEGVEKESFRQRVEAGEDISDALNFIPVQRGDFFYIPAGTIHAIGRGVTLLETQQSSGITYRVWDWNRVGLDGNPRELHIKKSFDVLNFSSAFQKMVGEKHKRELFRLREATLLESESFCIRYERVDRGNKVSIGENSFGRVTSLIVIEGGLQEEGYSQLQCCHSYIIREGSAELRALEDSLLIIVE